ncbi:MAG: sodium:calcium antiporter, partial [Rhodospirillales bacterium]|nr:sodium:calcium antiporter [Rhodospirillales bacterium]
TIIAFGTSLPELAASVVAAYRKHADLALGNILGSNIFNIVGIAGVVAVASPLYVPARIANFDMIVMAVATLLLMPFMIGNKEVISRPIAGFYLVVYLGYIAAIAAGMESFRF